jgi:DNA-binding response OmpR family regulator
MHPDTAVQTVKILLAEDNPADVLLIRETLTQQAFPYELLVQRDGEEMLKLIDRLERGELPCPEIVLLDLNLPRISGERILERMRGSAVCGNVPILIVTSSDSPYDRANAARLGATAYFRKPSDYDGFMQLGALVKSVLRGRGTESQ